METIKFTEKSASANSVLAIVRRNRKFNHFRCFRRLIYNKKASALQPHHRQYAKRQAVKKLSFPIIP